MSLKPQSLQHLLELLLETSLVRNQVKIYFIIAYFLILIHFGRTLTWNALIAILSA